MARAQDTGQAHDLARTRITNAGKAPVLVEPVVGSITFRTSHKTLALLPVAADGRLGAAVRIPVKDGIATAQLKPEYKTIFYAILAAN